jgi:hypothetical protein
MVAGSVKGLYGSCPLGPGKNPGQTPKSQALSTPATEGESLTRALPLYCARTNLQAKNARHEILHPGWRSAGGGACVSGWGARPLGRCGGSGRVGRMGGGRCLWGGCRLGGRAGGAEDRAGGWGTGPQTWRAHPASWSGCCRPPRQDGGARVGGGAVVLPGLIPRRRGCV